MSLRQPKIQRNLRDSFGGEKIQEIEIDHNQALNQEEDWTITLLNRLSMSPRFEVAVLDIFSWVASTALVTNGLVWLIRLGIVPTLPVLAMVLLFLCLLLVWATYLQQNYSDNFKSITGVRLLLLLVGALMGVVL